MRLKELIESEGEGRRSLRTISDKNIHNAEVQRLCFLAMEQAANRIDILNELLQYEDREESQTNGQHALDVATPHGGLTE